PLIGRCDDGVETDGRGQHLVTEPRPEGLTIGERGFAKAQERANFCPMIFDRAAVPIIGAPLRDRYPHLRRQVGYCRGGGVLGPLRKASLTLKELEQHRESQACRSPFATDQSRLGG